MIEDARQLRLRCAGLFHPLHLNGCSERNGSPSQVWQRPRLDLWVRLLSWGKELFAELHVDGLGTFTTAIRLGFEGHALAFIHGGKA